MPINVTGIDNKFKSKKQKDIKRQAEFFYMEKNASDKAKERFKSVPYQVKYAREHGKNGT